VHDWRFVAKGRSSAGKTASDASASLAGASLVIAALLLGARMDLDCVTRYPVAERADRKPTHRQEYASLVVANCNGEVAMHVGGRQPVVAIERSDPRCARAVARGYLGKVALEKTWRSDGKRGA